MSSTLVLIHVWADGCMECTEPLDFYAAVPAGSVDDPAATEVEFRVSACGCDPSLREQLASHGYTVSASDWSGGRATLHAL